MNKYLVTLLVLAFLLVAGALSKEAQAAWISGGPEIHRQYDEQAGVVCYTYTRTILFRSSASISCVQVAERGTPEAQL